MPDIIRETTELKVTPTGILPVYNENIIVLTSPNKQSNDFRWVIDLWISDKDNNYIKASNLVILPNPEGYGVIDLHRHIENYIKNDFRYNNKNIPRFPLNTYKAWYIDVKEEFNQTKWRFDDNYTIAPYTAFIGYENYTDKHPYEVGDIINIVQDGTPTHPSYDGTATVTQVIDDYKIITDKARISSTPVEPGSSNLVDAGTRTIYNEDIKDNIFYSFNGVFNYKDFITYNPDDYDNDSSATGLAKLLTNLPSTTTMNSDSNLWLQAYTSSNSIAAIMVASNNGFYYISLPTSTNTYGNEMKSAKIGPKDLLDTNTVPFPITGGLPVIDSSTEEYTIFLADGNPSTGIVQTSESMTIKINNQCSKYETINLFFLDRLGSFIPFTFNKLSRKNIENTTKTFSKNYGSYDSSSNTWGYETYDRGITTYDIVTKEKITCSTDWLNAEQNEIIQILFKSPEVYYLDKDGDMVGINITTKTFEEKKKINDKLINYTITFEIAQINRNQRA